MLSCTQELAGMGCEVCWRSRPLNKCTRCMSVHYCSRTCQEEHWKSHKKVCKSLRKRVDAFTRERQSRELEGNKAMLRNGVMTDLCDLGVRLIHDAVYECGSKYALLNAAQVCMDLLAIEKGDVTGLHGILVSIFMRLNRDQECYNFIKLYIKTEEELNAPGTDFSILPHMRKTADMGEDVPCLDHPAYQCRRVDHLCVLLHYIALSLIKFRLIINAVDDPRGFSTFMMGLHSRAGAGSPIEQLAGQEGPLMNIRAFVLQPAYRAIPSSGHLTSLHGRYSAQLERALCCVEEKNPHTFAAIVNPGPLQSLPPPHFSWGSGTVGQLQLAVPSCLPSWHATPGAMQLLRARVGEKPDYPVARPADYREEEAKNVGPNTWRFNASVCCPLFVKQA